jgi:hypothetical protein
MRYFLAIAEERSFTRAAKRCHVAQSSLSRQIRAMEVRLEARLLDRLPRIFDSLMPARYSRKKRIKRWSTAAVQFRWYML